MPMCNLLAENDYGSYKMQTHVLPLAGKPTVAMAIRPEWNRRPDSVLYSWAGASSPVAGKSWIASTKVLDFRLNRGEFAATSAVLFKIIKIVIETFTSKPDNVDC